MDADKKRIAVEVALYGTLFEDFYLGCYDSSSDGLKEVFTNLHDLPEWFTKYVDWEKIARDWQLAGELVAIETDDSKFHIFLPDDETRS